MAFDALYIILPVAAAIFGAGGGVFVKNIYDKNSAESKVAKADEMVKKMITDAQKRAETLKKETILEAKEEVYRLKTENERESKERRSELQRAERRLQQKEESFDKKQDTLEQREQQLAKRIKAIDAKEASVSKLYDAQQQELERVAGMTQDEAKDVLLNNVEKEARHEAALIIRDIESKAKAEADRRAVNIISMAIQRCAADHVAESTVSVVALPNDEMKGRIIGREGRNIRTLETATGVDLIIDDTPEAVILSGFDPMRREVARIALEKLILDGRIHPARIEEMVEKARKEVETQIREAGEQAVFESGVHGLHHELVRLLGRLRYRTSYGQNVLKHSIEVSHLAGLMATELGVVRLHGAGAVDLLIAEHAVAHAEVGDSRQIIPLRRALILRHGIECRKRADIVAHGDPAPRAAEHFGVRARVALLPALAVPSGERVAVIRPRRGLGRVFDLVVCRVDPVHHLRGMRIARIHVRVIFFGKLPVGALDLFIRRAGLQPEHAIGIVDHVSFSFAGANCRSYLSHTP